MEVPRWLWFAGSGFALLLVAAMAFAIFEPIQVLPRLRLAPGYAMATAEGDVVTSESVRGSVVLYSFASTDCDADCAASFATMAEVRDRVTAGEAELGDVDFRLVTIALDADPTAAELAAASAASGADGTTWRWVAGDEATVANVVGAGFRLPLRGPDGGSGVDETVFVLVDGLGVVRGDYRYRTLADDADKLVRHVDILGREIRYANGASAVAYEAAHLFLCYP